MTNIDVRIRTATDTRQSAGAFAGLEAQVAALNAQLAKMITLQNGVDAKGFQNLARAAAMNDANFRNAAASTGMFHTEQMRVNSATDEYVKNLNKQRLSFKDLMKQRKVASAAYREQLAMEQMMIRQNAQTTARGRQMVTSITPTGVTSDMNTAGRRMAFFNEQIRSGAHQMVNWGKNTQWAGRQLMVGFTLPLVAAGAAAGVLAYKIDQEFTRIQKVYDTTADANSTSMREQMKVEKELADLREAGGKTALYAAQNYGAAATDTLNVQAELAATGVKGAELQKSTSEVMRIARLGELEHQDALGATIALQTVFRQNTDQLARSFNYMNSIENATSLTTEDFAKAIPIAAAPVKAFGGDLEELGVLLTAMKSRGIAATEGANAIKAAMQRLGRPSKQIQQEWTALTNTDITKIFQDSESLTEIFTKIREATVDLSRQDRTKAFAGLFGTYQVTRMSALVEGMGDLETGYGQTARAAEIAGQSSAEWANVAEREMERLNKSVSGQFKNALEEAKVLLAGFGEPFIKVATMIIKGVSWLMKGFMALPGPIKTAIALGLGIAAIAGPIIMLVGLSANLIGNFIRMGTSLVGLVVNMKILDKESRVAQLSAKLVENGYISQRTSVQQLAVAYEQLAVAQAQATRSTVAGVAAAQRGLKGVSPWASPAGTTPAPVMGSQMYGPARPTSNADFAAYGMRAPNGSYGTLNPAQRVEQGRAVWAARMAAAAERARISTEGTTQASKKMNTYLRGGAVSGGIMAASMATMMLTTNETANNVAKFAMIAAIAAPAVTLLWQGLKAAYLYAVMGGKALLAWGTRLAFASAAAFTMNGALAGARTLIMGIMGPIGWITVALTAVGYALYKLQKAQAEEVKENLDAQKNLNSMAEDYASSIGKSRKEWEGIRGASQASPIYDDYDKARTYYRENEDGMAEADTFGELGPGEQEARAMQIYGSLVTDFGMNAKQAQAQIAALYNVGAGVNATQSLFNAKGISEELGNIATFDFGDALVRAGDLFRDSMPVNDLNISNKDFEDLARTNGEAYSHEFQRAISNASNTDEAKQMFARMFEDSLAGYEEILAKESENNTILSTFLEGQNVNSAEELSKLIGEEGEEGMAKLFEEAGYSAETYGGILSKLMNARNSERAIIGTWAKDYTDLGGSVNNVNRLMDTFEYKVATMSMSELKDEATMNIKDTIAGLGNVQMAMLALGQPTDTNIAEHPVFAKLRSGAKVTKEELRSAFNELDPAAVARLQGFFETIAQDRGLKIGKTAWETYNNVINGVKDDADKTKKSIDDLNSSVAGMNFTKPELLDMRKTAMQGVQEEIAEAAQEQFDDRMEASIEAREKMWEKRSEALDNQIERDQEALDNRIERESDALEKEFERREEALDAKWERKNDSAEKYWDRRVERIDKAIEAEQKAEKQRQQMFDNEIARIERLNQAMNRNIDFNVALNAGEFDEAAKIRNDVTADATKTVLERARDAGSGASERRVGSLEDRKNRLAEAREEYMKRLKNEEEAERKSLARVRERRQKALEKQHEDMRKALERRSEAQRENLEALKDADLKAQREIWEREKVYFERRMDAFTAYIATNKKDLNRHMKQVGLSYDDFGEKLKRKGTNWSTHFGNSFQSHLHDAAQAMRSDKVWERLGSDSKNAVLRGMGFNNMGEFRHFMETGEMPKGGVKPAPKSGGNKSGGSGPSDAPPGTPGGPSKTMHTGGMVGKNEGSRKGVARTQKTLGPSEQMIRAQKGEYIVNRFATAKNQHVLEAINKGNGSALKGMHGGLDGPAGKAIGGPSGYVGRGLAIPGLVTGMAASGFAAGVQAGMEKMYEKKAAEMAAAAMYGSIPAGLYGDVNFDAEQLSNALIIANTGKKMGMSERDVIIGLMTAMQESGLRNLDYGDRDSLGLFQQRPSMGWGTAAQVTDPEYASRKFFDTLRGVTDRENMSLSAAAQAVQRSAYPSAYAKWENEARAILRAMNQAANFGGDVYGSRRYDLPGTKPWVNEAGQYLGNKYKIPTIYGVGSRPGPSDHPAGLALDFMTGGDFGKGDALAADVIKMHGVLDATYAIWKQRITSANGGWGNWRAMEDRGSPTANHMDHVHVSFSSTGRAGDLPKLKTGSPTGGSGGKHRPTSGGLTQELHYNNAVDIGAPVGTPVVAADDGTVSGSWDIPGYEPRQSHGGNGYKSYGRVITINHGAFSTLYAHLRDRYVQKGAKVRGGARIGVIGMAGNTSGPHLHFEAHGQSPYAFLKQGGTVKHDNTPAILHKDERVLTAPLTQKLDKVVDTMYSAAKGGKSDDRARPRWVDTLPALKGGGDKYGDLNYPKNVTGAADSPYTFFDVLTKFAKGQKKEQGPDDNTGNIRTASMNFDHKYGPSRRAEMTRLMGRSDIMGLSDYKSGGPGGSFTNWIRSKGWGFHKPEGDSPVIWNSDKYQASKNGSLTFPNGRGGKAAMNYVMLRGASRPFWAASTHTAAHTHPGGGKCNHGIDNHDLQKAQFAGIRNRLAEMRKAAPVLLMGDFNEDTNEEPTLRNLLPGMTSNWAGSKYRKGPGTLGSRYVDQTLADSIFKLLGSQIMRIGGLHGGASLAQYSLPQMKVGGDIRWNNTIANLHKDERVLTAPLTKKLDVGLENLATGGQNGHTININGVPQTMNEDKLATVIVRKLERSEARKPQSRKVVTR